MKRDWLVVVVIQKDIVLCSKSLRKVKKLYLNFVNQNTVDWKALFDVTGLEIKFATASWILSLMLSSILF